jgi:RNA polymerase sigma-70 factor, ECF subfamily
MTLDPDAELMLRVKNGDQRSFAALFDRYAKSIVNFAYRYVGERSRAEELTQDIFLKVYRSASSYEPTARFKTWLFRIAANHCLNEVRRGVYRAGHASIDDKPDEEGPAMHLATPASSGPDAALAGRDMERALSEVLERLPERERAAFTMCRFEGVAYRDIAEALNTTESAVKSMIHRATVAIAKCLESFTNDGPRDAATPAAGKGS